MPTVDSGHKQQRTDVIGKITVHLTTKEIVMVFTAAHISPIIALAAGILILILPRLLNYVVAIYLIVIGLIGLNGIYHFIH
jgi:hypothetical protein